MDYLKHYNRLVATRKMRGWYFINRQGMLTARAPVPVHRHHILPRSDGLDDHPDNLVVLTHREHVLAHLLLSKAFPDNSLYAKSTRGLMLTKRITMSPCITRIIHKIFSKHKDHVSKKTKDHLRRVNTPTAVVNLTKKPLGTHKEVITPKGYFMSIQSAMLSHNLSKYKVMKRLNSDEYPDWIYKPKPDS